MEIIGIQQPNILNVTWQSIDLKRSQGDEMNMSKYQHNRRIRGEDNCPLRNINTYCM